MSNQDGFAVKQRDVFSFMKNESKKDKGFVVIDLTDDNEDNETISFLEKTRTKTNVAPDISFKDSQIFPMVQNNPFTFDRNGYLGGDASTGIATSNTNGSITNSSGSKEYTQTTGFNSSPFIRNDGLNNTSGSLSLVTDDDDDDDVVMVNEVRLTPHASLSNQQSIFPMHNQPIPLPSNVQHGNPAIFKPRTTLNANPGTMMVTHGNPTAGVTISSTENRRTSEDLFISNEMKKLVDNITSKINSTSLMIESYRRHIKNDREKIKKIREEIKKLDYQLKLNLEQDSLKRLEKAINAKQLSMQTLTDDINVWKETADKCATDLRQFKNHKKLMVSHPEAFVNVLKKKRRQQITLANQEINQQQIALYGKQNGKPIKSIVEGDRVFSEEDKDISKLIENILPDHDSFNSQELLPEPKGLTIKLLKHQRIGLDWICKMEKGSNKGGILADDMGLGKTVQALAAILTNPPLNKRVKTTLIVGPVALLRQWQAEIRQKIDEKHKLSTFLFHSSEKVKSFRQLAQFDIVLTSYGTLSSEFKKHFKEYFNSPENKGTLPLLNDGGVSYLSPFFSKETMFHRIILDEAHIIKNKKTLASKACASVLANYRLCLTGTPIQNNVEELYSLVRFLKIKPHNKEEAFRKLIILPLKDSGRNYDKLEKSSAMRRLQVLLKAILLRRTKSSKIDGQPILKLTQRLVDKKLVKIDGDEGEFYQILSKAVQKEARKLLGSEKLGDYSNVLTLLLRLRQACCHSFLVRIGDRVKEVVEEENNDSLYELGMGFGDDGNRNGTSSGVRQLKTMIRNCRTFSSGAIEAVNSQYATEASYCQMCSDLLVYDNSCILHPCGHALCIDCVESFFENCAVGDEEDRATCTQCGKAVDRSQIVHYKVFNEICNLQKSDAQTINHFLNGDSKKQLVVDQEGFNLLKDFYSHIRVNGPINLRQSVLLEFLKADPNAFQPSPKMKQCLEIINDIFSKSNDDKVIIFSQFTLFFDLFGKILNDHGIQYLRYDGSMTMDERNACIERFYENPHKRVMLISLKAGNFGLTLTCASHVIIIDPFWNPFVEEQAMDRAHRIGQLKDVHVYRLLSEGTVEERIMDLQEQKRELVNRALSETEFKNISRLGRKELGFLFGINGR